MDFPVYVICHTFNQSAYIIDALDGFCMQITDFPYICIIMDDASTDGEQTVIRDYLNTHFCLDDKSLAKNEESEDYVMTYAQHRENTNCYFAVFYLKYNHYSKNKEKSQYYSRWNAVKYIAMCEGDDYWTDSRKLQIQFDFLEDNPNYGFVYSDYSFYYQENGLLRPSMIARGEGPKIENFEQHLVLAGYIAPPSWFYRSELQILQEKYSELDFIDTSYAFALEVFLSTNVHCMMRDTCVRRVIGESASQSKCIYKKINYIKNVFAIQLYYARKYSNSRDTINTITENYYSRNYPYLLINNDSHDISQIKRFVTRKDTDRIKTIIKKGMLRNAWSRKVLKLWIYYKYFV